MGFLHKYDKSKFWMRNVIEKLFLKTHEKFLSDYVPSVTKRNKKFFQHHNSMLTARLNVLSGLSNSKNIYKAFQFDTTSLEVNKNSLNWEKKIM